MLDQRATVSTEKLAQETQLSSIDGRANWGPTKFCEDPPSTRSIVNPEKRTAEGCFE